MKNLVGKSISLKLVGLNGNIFTLMGMFQEQAKREGWSKGDIMKVMEACMDAGGYESKIAVLAAHCLGGGSGVGDTDDMEDIAELTCDPCDGCDAPNCNGCKHADDDVTDKYFQ